VGTRYGLLLLGKVGVVAFVLLLALDNKRRLTPAIEAGDAGARTRLARNVRLEIAGIGAIILITALLGRTPPPRVLAEAQPAHEHAGHTEPLTAHAVDARGRHAEITITPGSAGRNVVTVRFTGPGGSAVTAKEVQLQAALPERGIEPITRTMTLAPDGARYESGDLNLPGRWSLRIDALVSDFDKAIFETELELR
jgi:copper transport protein